MCSSLRVSRHPRGHIAECNGRVELVSAKVEQCRGREGSAARMAVFAEARSREESVKREERLRSFQREVRERLKIREKRRQLQVAASSGKVVLCEQRVAEEAVSLEVQGRKPPQSSFPHGAVPDVDDAGIIGTRVCTERKDGHPSVSQLARKALLAQMQGAKEQAIPIEAGLCCADRCSGAYHEVNQGLGHLKPADKEPAAVKGSEPSKSGSTHSHLRFTPVGRLEQAERKQAGEQYLLFRRLYSDLERVQVRQRQLRKSHCERVQRLKREKEADRRVAEDEVNPMESFTSTVSSEAAEEGQKAVEWAEMVALEERRHQLQRLKESERYIDALRERLRGRLTQQQATVPPLCSCGSSVWDAGPDTCANNCVFYKNPRAYARTLSNLLASLDK